jgi:hypothetical protein
MKTYFKTICIPSTAKQDNQEGNNEIFPEGLEEKKKEKCDVSKHE